MSIVMTAHVVDYKIHWLKMMSVPESRAIVGRHDGINGMDSLDGTYNRIDSMRGYTDGILVRLHLVNVEALFGNSLDAVNHIHLTLIESLRHSIACKPCRGTGRLPHVSKPLGPGAREIHGRQCSETRQNNVNPARHLIRVQGVLQYRRHPQCDSCSQRAGKIGRSLLQPCGQTVRPGNLNHESLCIPISPPSPHLSPESP